MLTPVDGRSLMSGLRWRIFHPFAVRSNDLTSDCASPGEGGCRDPSLIYYLVISAILMSMLRFCHTFWAVCSHNIQLGLYIFCWINISPKHRLFYPAEMLCLVAYSWTLYIYIQYLEKIYEMGWQVWTKQRFNKIAWFRKYTSSLCRE